MRKLKENRKKGFTLVELIVVLVILAILAALLVPALTGYIDKAKNKQIIAETRQCVMAAQTLLDEDYAKGTTPLTAPTAANVQTLAEVPSNDITVTIDASGHVTQLVYKHGKTCTYTKTANANGENYAVDP